MWLCYLSSAILLHTARGLRLQFVRSRGLTSWYRKRRVNQDRLPPLFPPQGEQTMYGLRLFSHVLKLMVLTAFMSATAEAASSYNSVTVVRLNVFQASSGANPGSLIIFSPAISDTEGCTKSGQGYAWIDWTSTL